MADLFRDCEIKSYLYFGPDHDFLCPDLLCKCVRVFVHMCFVQYVCYEICVYTTLTVNNLGQAYVGLFLGVFSVTVYIILLFYI